MKAVILATYVSMALAADCAGFTWPTGSASLRGICMNGEPTFEIIYNYAGKFQMELTFGICHSVDWRSDPCWKNADPVIVPAGDYQNLKTTHANITGASNDWGIYAKAWGPDGCDTDGSDNLPYATLMSQAQVACSGTPPPASPTTSPVAPVPLGTPPPPTGIAYIFVEDSNASLNGCEFAFKVDGMTCSAQSGLVNTTGPCAAVFGGPSLSGDDMDWSIVAFIDDGPDFRFFFYGTSDCSGPPSGTLDWKFDAALPMKDGPWPNSSQMVYTGCTGPPGCTSAAPSTKPSRGKGPDMIVIVALVAAGVLGLAAVAAVVGVFVMKSRSESATPPADATAPFLNQQP